METAADFPVRLLVTVGALIAVLVLAWAVLRFVASLGGARRSGHRLKVLETLPLGSRERLVLVQIDEREILVGVSQAGVSVIEASNTTDDKDASDDMTTMAPPSASTNAT